MEETEDVATNVRRTRSGKVVATPPTPAAKPATRRTRKKVVLMEVEVSDDEEEVPQDEKNSLQNKEGSDDEVDEKKLEEKLLETPEESNESTEHKDESVNNVDKEKEKVGSVELNGSGEKVVEVKPKEEESITFVLNDVEMFETTEIVNEPPEKEEPKNKKETEDLKMDVDEEEFHLPQKAEIIVSQEITDTVVKDTDNGTVVSEHKEVKKVTIVSQPTPSVTEEPTESIDKSKDESVTIEEITESTEEVKSKEEIKAVSENVEETETKEEPKKEDPKKSKSRDITKELTVNIISDTKVSKPEISEEKVKVESKKEDNIEEDEKMEVTSNEEKKKQEKVDEVTEKVVEKKVETEEKKVETEEKKEKAEEKKEKTEEKVETETKKEETETKKEETEAKKEESEEKKEETEAKKEEPEAKKEETEAKKQITEEKEQNGVVEKEEVAETKNEKKTEEKTDKESEEKVDKPKKDEKKDEQNGEPDAENISEDELPVVQAVKVPEAEEVSDEELPGPKRAELPADTEVVSEDELPTVKTETKKEGVKRKLNETDYDPGSPTSENETPSKKPSLEAPAEKEKEEKPKPKKLPELDKYWKAVNDDPTDFTGWTYLLQYVDQENDMEAAREAYDAFLSHYPYCYGYWRKYADYEKRKGNKKKCEEVFERGLKAIPLSVDLWIHYLTYVKTTRADDEEYIRSQFDRALGACGLEFRSDRLWDSFIKWETEGKRLQRVTTIYDRLLATPTQGYTTHFDNFQEHISSNPPNKVVEVDEFLALRKEVRHMLKHDVTTENADNSDAPPGDEDQSKVISSDEETKSIRERIVSIRRKIHKSTVNAVTSRWNYEEGIKRPYFHIKPLERCQLKNWQDYLDYETEQGDRVRIIVLFERCLIACALYEEFWLKFVHYLEGLNDPEVQPKIRDVYERACTIHHLKKPNLHLQWAMFEESVDNCNRAAEILVNLEKSVPNVLQVAYRRINLERRREDHEKCGQLYEHYINNSKNKMISSNIAIKYSRFCLRVMKNLEKAQEALKTAITKDPNNPRLYLQLIDLTLQKENVTEAEIIEIIDSFLEKDSTDVEQKVLFAQRKLEYLEDFGTNIQSVQTAYEQYQKIIKQNKDVLKKKEIKSESSSSNKKEKSATQSSSQSSSYGNYGNYGTSSNQPTYPYSGSQQGQYNYSQYGQGDQYQYQNWQYPQGSYGGYNQWGGYSGGYGY